MHPKHASSLARLVVSCALLISIAIPHAFAQAPEVEVYEYTVREGDTCAGISRRAFGDAHRYDIIHAYNPGMGPPPHRLEAGTVLRLPRTATSAGDLPEARVTQVERDVRARSADVEDWRAAQRGLGLFRGWHVRTQEEATAELTFRDTSVVHLREDTLIIIFGEAAGTVRQGGTSATLERGTLRSRLGELRGGIALHLTTTSGSADFQGGSSVVSVDAEGTSRVSVHEGEARLRGASGAPTRVPAGMGSKVRVSERPMRPRPLPPTPAWVTPGPLRFVGVEGRGASVSGAWGSVERAAVYRVEIARLADGREVVAAAEVPSSVTRFELHGLPAGSYHVRVASIDDDHFESQPSSALAIDVAEVSLLAPGAGEPDAATSAAATVEPTGDAPPPLRALTGARLVAPADVLCTASDAPPVRETLLSGEGSVEVRCATTDGGLLAPLTVELVRPTVHVEGAEGQSAPTLLRGARETLTLTLDSDLSLPSDLTIVGTEQLVVGEVLASSTGWTVEVTPGLDAPSPGTLRFVSRAAPDATLATLNVVLEDPPPPPVEEIAAPLPEPVATASAPLLHELAGGSLFASTLALRDPEIRGQSLELGSAWISRVGEHERYRITTALRASLLDDQLSLHVGLPVDATGVARQGWERGSLDLFGSASWLFVRRDPAVPGSLSLALEVGAWFPTHPAEETGLPVVRLVPSLHLAMLADRHITFRTRQGALIDLDGTGARLWASAYGLDVWIWSAISVAVELDLSVGRDDGREVFAAAVAPALALDFSPFTMTLGMRFGVNPYGRELYGPAALLMGMRLSL